MRRIYLIAAIAVVAVVGVVCISTYIQANDQRASLAADLQYRTHALADSLQESIEPSFSAQATTSMQRVVDSIASDQRVSGIGVYDASGALVASSSDMQTDLVAPALVSNAMDSDAPADAFVESSSGGRYVFAEPMHDDQNHVIGAIAIVQSSQYIDQAIWNTWQDNLWRLVVQILLIVAVVFALVRFVFYSSITRFAESLERARVRGQGDVQGAEDIFKPIAGEISKVTTSLRQARRAASEEARLRLEKLESPWTAERLKEFIKATLKERPIYTVSNREPYIHSKNKGEIVCSVPASGMVTALEPVMEATGGVWLAHGSGDADKETADAEGKLRVPPDDPRYTLKRVWLTPKEIKGHYVGFSNEALWPLCHQAHTRPIFRQEDWKEYRRVNGKFAQALLAEIKNIERPLILVQDFHLALLPKMIKDARPDAQVSIFWHIPWPNPEAFSICPWRREILEGMLGADLIGFHTQQYCNNFMDTVGSEIEALIDLEEFTVTRRGHASSIQPFPISIAFSDADGAETPVDRAPLEALGIRTEHLVLGVDRLDYIKGILERFKGLEFLLDESPEYREKVTLLQIAPPSREQVEKYREYDAAVTAEAGRINEKFGSRAWQPIVLEKKHYSHAQLDNLYRLADACIVTSLHDGMNLVAKEFPAARVDEAGVLILSNFTGAARDLKGAILVNPYSAEETARALKQALTMPKAEQHRRMKQMREALRDYNIYRWSAEFIKALAQLG